MDIKTLLSKITELSLRDNKTLSQKGLKAAEEVGELGKAILPLEGARGTNHRVPNHAKVIEECADIMLVAYSIVAAEGVVPEEFAKVLQRKMDYWEFLLDNEDKADLTNLDFEIHITVREANLEKFIADCSLLNVKPIILDLYTKDSAIKDMMTSSRFKGSTVDVVAHTKQLGLRLREMGYDVAREKIETVPWHPAAQIKPARDSAYFEAHIPFVDCDPLELRAFATANDIHLSRNTMKKGDRSIVMGTFRLDSSLTNPIDFNNTVVRLCDLARSVLGVDLDRPHTEYSLFDTNEMHDGEWIKS